ncbi:hypothetical protein COCOBI_04-2950 [Coccomyxa sp. Obi]|nr:hypothetical protein COCOBI_04-2950 [Coccomyxa sp. Obi]
MNTTGEITVIPDDTAKLHCALPEAHPPTVSHKQRAFLHGDAYLNALETKKREQEEGAIDTDASVATKKAATKKTEAA